MPRRNVRKGGRRRRGARQRANVTTITTRPSFKGMPVLQLMLPATQVIYSTTVTTGVIASSYPINPVSQVVGWSTRFVNTFDEWRVASAVVEIIPMGLNVGVTSFFWSEEGVSVTVTEAQERTAKYVKNNEQKPENIRMRWTNEDYTDDTFRGVATSFTAANLNVYTDGTNFGSPVTVTQLYMLRAVMCVQFRGLAST